MCCGCVVSRFLEQMVQVGSIVAIRAVLLLVF